MTLKRFPWTTLALLALLLFVQAQLWVGDSGKRYTMKLQLELDHQLDANEAAQARNDQLVAEVRDLREGLEMIEERARWELGMVKPDEILVQVTARPPETTTTRP